MRKEMSPTVFKALERSGSNRLLAGQWIRTVNTFSGYAMWRVQANPTFRALSRTISASKNCSVPVFSLSVAKEIAETQDDFFPRFFPTIAAQLADILPGLSHHVAKAIDSDSLVRDANLAEQFEKLLLHPLVKLEQASAQARRLIIGVDALDECERESEIRRILTRLIRVPELSSLCLQVFVTSRPEFSVKLGFGDIKTTLPDIVLEEVQADTIEHDIRACFDFRFKQIKQDRSLRTYNQLPTDWPGEDNIEALVNLAVPLFIFAFTVCRYIADSRP